MTNTEEAKQLILNSIPKIDQVRKTFDTCITENREMNSEECIIIISLLTEAETTIKNGINLLEKTAPSTKIIISSVIILLDIREGIRLGHKLRGLGIPLKNIQKIFLPKLLQVEPKLEEALELL